MPRDEAVTEAFVGLADAILSNADVSELADRFVGHCLEFVDDCGVGLWLSGRPGLPELLTVSSERVRLLELSQMQAGEGPSAEVWKDGSMVRCPDLRTTGGQWSAFATVAAAAGFASVTVLPMRLRDENVGAAVLYGKAPGVPADDDLRTVQALLDIVAVGVLREREAQAHERTVGQLKTALSSRVVIEQAKGILGERYGVSPGRAFEVLRAVARSNNLVLRELAESVVLGTEDVDGLR